MTDIERVMPPLDGDERATLAGWLDFHRQTLVGKVDGLDGAALRTASAPPSPVTLLGLVQHLAEVERNWFQRVLLGADVPAIWDPTASTDGDDGGFDLDPDVDLDAALAVWRREVEVSRANAAARALDATSPFLGGAVSLRWIHVHMVGEYARHLGHADLVRERIDGATGI